VQGVPHDVAARQAAYELVQSGQIEETRATLDACYGPELLQGQPSLNFRQVCKHAKAVAVKHQGYAMHVCTKGSAVCVCMCVRKRRDALSIRASAPTRAGACWLV